MTSQHASTDAVTALAAELVKRPSITPEDGGCQELIASRLQAHGFSVEHMPCGPVENLWAWHGTGSPLVVLAGHTDVVPPGPEEQWHTPPFAAEIVDGMLRGRGTADMKGSVAAMVVACEEFVRANPDHPGTLALLLTSDEEGPAVDGTRHVIDQLQRRGQQIDHAIVGEPSSMQHLGDTLRIGRRGSLTGNLHIQGIQGHVAYPERARNPVHTAAPAITDLLAVHWDEGNAHFPPTSLQIASIHAGTGADNVIPADLRLVFNLRYSTQLTADAIKSRVRDILERHGLDYTLDWHHSGQPFLTEPGTLTDCMTEAIHAVTGRTPEWSTAGGTSDARFIAPSGAQVIEFGPLNRTIHQIDEEISIADLGHCAAIFQRALTQLLVPGR